MSKKEKEEKCKCEDCGCEEKEEKCKCEDCACEEKEEKCTCEEKSTNEEKNDICVSILQQRIHAGRINLRCKRRYD